MSHATQYEVEQDCPRCGNPIPIRIMVSGRRIAATRTDPAEYPDLDVTEIICDTGCHLTDAERQAIELDARAHLSEQGDDAEDCGEYDTLEERDDYA